MRQKLILKSNKGEVVAVIESIDRKPAVAFAYSINLRLALADFFSNGIDVQRYSGDSVIRISAKPADDNFFEKLAMYFQLSYDYLPVIIQPEAFGFSGEDYDLGSGVWRHKPLTPLLHSKTFNVLLNVTDNAEKEAMRNLVLTNWLQDIIRVSEIATVRIDQEVETIHLQSSPRQFLFETKSVPFYTQKENIFRRLTNYLAENLMTSSVGPTLTEQQATTYFTPSAGHWRPTMFFDIAAGFQIVAQQDLSHWQESSSTRGGSVHYAVAAREVG